MLVAFLDLSARGPDCDRLFKNKKKWLLSPSFIVFTHGFITFLFKFIACSAVLAIWNFVSDPFSIFGGSKNLPCARGLLDDERRLRPRPLFVLKRGVAPPPPPRVIRVRERFPGLI